MANYEHPQFNSAAIPFRAIAQGRSKPAISGN